MTTCIFRHVAPLFMTVASLLVSESVAALNDNDTKLSTQLHKDIGVLASNEFEGRAPGTRGESLTVNYLVHRMKEIGISPGNGNSYLQSVPIVTTTTTNNPDLVINGKNQITLKYRSDAVLFTQQHSNNTSLDNSDLVFVGYGINAPERNWNDYEGVDVTGKTVVMLINDPGFATQDPELFEGNRMTYYGRWDYKFEEAARQGASGAIIVHETAAASYPWAVVENSWTGGQISVKSKNRNAHRTQVEGWIQLPAAKRLFKAAGLDFSALRQAASENGFKAVDLNLTASTSLTNTLSEAESNNVVGLVKGTELPDEYIVYTAHWDHLGKKNTPHGTAIYNGAIDNATGTAALLAIGERFAKQPTKRSIVFLAVTAEESGLLGSKWYTHSPIYPIKQTIANINMDALGVWGETNDVIVVGMGQSDLDSTLAEHAKKQDRYLKSNPRPEAGYYFRSDHFPFARAGIPALYASAGDDARGKDSNYVTDKKKEYTAHAYHEVGDKYDPNWDLGSMVQDIKLLHGVGESVSNADAWPKWSATSEFSTRR